MREDYDSPSAWSLEEDAEQYHTNTVVVIWTADDDRLEDDTRDYLANTQATSTAIK